MERLPKDRERNELTSYHCCPKLPLPPGKGLKSVKSFISYPLILDNCSMHHLERLLLVLYLLYLMAQASLSTGSRSRLLPAVVTSPGAPEKRT